MSEKTTKILGQDEQAPVEEVGEQKDPSVMVDGEPTQIDGKIVNYFVGLAGANIYRVSTDAETLNLRDYIESISTIEINTLSGLIMQEEEEALKGLQLYVDMKAEILKAALGLIVDASQLSDIGKEAAKKILGATSIELNTEKSE
jgi:hypothetical protein